MLVALVVLLFAQSGAPAVATRPAVAGHWEGIVRRGGSQLAIRLDLADGARNRNFFSAPDLGAIDIPLAHVRVGRTLHAELVGDTSTALIDATVDGNVMTGTFRERALRTGIVRLHRVAASIARPYATQPATFANGDVHLAGTIYVPRTSGKHPAVVLVQGSGPEGRWATAYIADALARRGVIALSYDKRGVGGSSGDWRTATFDDLSADARAAVHLLAQRADVDPSRLGVYGHSQGGFLAPMIAENDPEVAWIGDADGPVGPQYRQDLFRVDTALAKRYSGRDLADAEKLYAEFVDTARNGTPHARLRTDMAEAGDPDWLDLLAIPDDDSWIWPWYAKTGNYDNSPAWGTVRVPVLILFGANDELVPPRESIAETVLILKEHDDTKVTVHVFPGADHTLRIPPANRDGWPHNAPGFPDILAEFAQHSIGDHSLAAVELEAAIRHTDLSPGSGGVFWPDFEWMKAEQGTVRDNDCVCLEVRERRAMLRNLVWESDNGQTPAVKALATDLIAPLRQQLGVALNYLAEHGLVPGPPPIGFR